MPLEAPTSSVAVFRTVPVRTIDDEALAALSAEMKLSLSLEDMQAVQRHFRDDLERDPTDVELEVIAQTWSEHCKHRIFGAEIRFERDGCVETVDSIFKTYVKAVTEEVMAHKPDFVLSCFHDNAGFIRLDDEYAVCLKAETHNHPSAIEPYAGANTGLGGVIRDILGAGKGARPIGNLDVFCFGPPDTDPADVPGDTIHPIGMLRGVVRGVRDYGNRMGIPTVTGAIAFDPKYTCNPLVFCGTAGTIRIPDIDKEVSAGQLVVAVGGRTGRDGLHGATFSSAALDTDSHEDDVGAVQIGNPIEEKKVHDFVLQARDEGLIAFITDCGAGGFSSAAGEMIADTGGEIRLESAPLKTAGMQSWEIFLSESQERMVLAAEPKHWPRLQELAALYETEATILGEVGDSRVLRVSHHGETVVELTSDFLHEAPRRKMVASHTTRSTPEVVLGTGDRCGHHLRTLLVSPHLCSREPIIREYDHEVQGNTVLKPLAGPGGDCPQDGSVIEVGDRGHGAVMAVSLLPEYGKVDPYRMGLSCIDEAMRQCVAAGGDPDRVGLLDNFCLGNPDNPDELGALVEAARGMAEAATAFQAPFISGKDSFYNYFETEDGPISIPCTLLVSAIALMDNVRKTPGSSLRRAGSTLILTGTTLDETGGSALARQLGQDGSAVPGLDVGAALASYRAVYGLIGDDRILAVHDCSDGGLAVAVAEMGFSGVAGIEADVSGIDLPATTALFSESNGRLLLEVAPEHVEAVTDALSDVPHLVLGSSTEAHDRLVIRKDDTVLLDEPLSDLKALWKKGLTPYY